MIGTLYNILDLFVLDKNRQMSRKEETYFLWFLSSSCTEHAQAQSLFLLVMKKNKSGYDAFH